MRRDYRSKISNQIVDLDGSEYVECEFNTCLMRFSGHQPYTMVGCTLANCRFELSGPAANMVRFMSGMYQGGGEGGRELILDLIYTITNGDTGRKLVSHQN